MNKKNRLRFTRCGLWPPADVFIFLLDVMAQLGRVDRQGLNSQTPSNAAMVRNVEWSMMNV
jgi:hypothetical protein